MDESSSVAVEFRRSRAEVARLVEEFEQSGMTRTAFCREREISPHTPDYYLHKQRQQERGSGAQQLVPVQLVGRLPARSSELRVELGNGRRIGVEAGFDAQLLKRLIAVLEG